MPLPTISVVFVTYDRLVTLIPTLESFLANTDYPRERLQLIVADDASPAHVQSAIGAMPFDVFCLSSKRGGMGINCNRGLSAATGDLVLQLQDDWRCLGPADYLQRAVKSMDASPETGLILLKPNPNRPAVRRIVPLERGELRVYDNRPGRTIASVAEQGYSDWPHLKRSAFVKAIGPYAERPPMWDVELDYSRRINAQTEWFVADLPDVDAFTHIGEKYSYNWPWKRRVEHQLRRLPGGARILGAYRNLKRGPRQPREEREG